MRKRAVAIISRRNLLSHLLLSLLFGISSRAETVQPALIKPQDRISSAVATSALVSIPNSVHPAIALTSSSIPVDPGMALSHMMLTLQPSAIQQAALISLLDQQSDPNSPNFHKFLTPAQFAASFGVSSNDVNKITAWLTSNGFHIDEVAASNLAITFSGNVSQVEAAFKTEIRQYVVNGATHYANATAPMIPESLSSVVGGFVKLNDLHSQSAALGKKAVPLFNSATGAHYLVPADYAIIYDLNPLYTNGFAGAAQSIAIVGRSNVNPTDIATFRADYGLPGNAVIPVFATGVDPGVTNDDNTLEGTLDVEWAGAVAPYATIKYVIAASTTTTDGVDIAAQYAVNHNVAPVLSVSYGACEATTNNAFYNLLWQQAAVQGISVFVAAGDSGAAGCDGSSSVTGTVQSVNGICSTPYDTCVGGTMFDDTANPSTWWLPGNNAVMGSAVSYIPEVAWNESALTSGGTGLAAGGGGVSGVWLKPYYQTGSGVPNDGHRDVPDISLSAAQHDGYMIYYNGSTFAVAGTSAATPAFAAMITLVNQRVGSSQGNVNQVLYPLAARGTQAGAVPVFHDIVSGNNSVPGVSGHSAGVGYDLVTGLGSVDATQMANQWTSVTGGFTLTASAISVNLTPNVNSTINLTLTDLGTFNSAVTLSISNLPTGIIANFAPGTITGTGTSVLTFSAAGTAVSGTYPITVTANGGNFTRTVSFNLVVVVSTSCTLSAAPTSLTIVEGQGSSTKLVCGSAQGIFGSGLLLSVAGTPIGATASFSPSASVNAGTGVSNLIINTTTAVTPGTYTLIVTATLANPAFTTSLSIPVTINAPATFNVTPSATSVSIVQGSTGTLTLTSLHSGSFNSPVTFQTSGLPSTVTAMLSATSVAAPGDGSITINFAAMSVATPKTYALTVVAQGAGLVLKIPIAVTITVAPAFTLTSSLAVMTLRQSYVSPTNAIVPGTAAANLTIANLTNGFNLPVALSVGTLPAGVTAAFSPATLSAPGSGVSILTLTASANATTGVTTISVSATGGTITRVVNIQLILTPPPTFNLSASYPSYNLTAGASFTEVVTSTALYGYTSNIQLSAATPTGINATFLTTTIKGAGGTTNLTIQAAISMVAGTYAITVTGTDLVTGNVQSTQITVVVGTVTTALTTSRLSVARLAVGSVTISATATSYTGGTVALSISGVPAGATYSLSATSLGGSGVSTLTILAGSGAQPGVYTVYVTTKFAGIMTNTPLYLTIT